MQLAQRTLEQRRHAFLEDYRKICQEQQIFICPTTGLSEIPSPTLFELHLECIKLRTLQRHREIEKHH